MLYISHWHCAIRNMPLSSSSGSDSEAPEAVALVHSKKSAQKQNADIRKAHAFAREKTRLKNRQKDQKLKERAASNKKNGPVPSQKTGNVDEDDDQRQDSNDAEARMLRAMKDAEGKKREDIVMEGRDDADNSGDYSSINVDEDYLEVDSDEDEADQNMGSDPESEPTTKKPSNYLPDELFKAAFSQANKTLSPQSKSNHPTHLQRSQKKRKSTSSTPKDVIVGCASVILILAVNNIRLKIKSNSNVVIDTNTWIISGGRTSCKNQKILESCFGLQRSKAFF